MKRNSICLAVLVDAFRYDYLNEIDTPFFRELAQSGIDACVQETFAFQLRPAFFAGLYPEECNIANLYCYNPQSSPFKNLPFHLFDRKTIHQAIREQEALRGNTATRHIADIAEIPEPLLPYFDLSEKKLTTDPHVFGERASLFDIMREYGKKWLWIAYPTHDQRVDAILHEFERGYVPELDFIYLHFAELDWAGHEHGPHSAEQKQKLLEIDHAVEKIYRKLKADFNEVRAVIFGDHGMVKITKCYDIEAELAATGLSAPDDYLYFLDSTQARFWFFQESAREAIIRLLGANPYGRLLESEDLARLRSRFKDNRYGELIFAANNGILLFPNFLQKTTPCRGMHGYLPEVEANWGRLLIHGLGKRGTLADPVSMVSLFPTFLDLLELPIPSTCQVPSIFRILEAGEKPIGADLPDLSVIIPTYSRKDKLAELLQGLKAQQLFDESFEIIVVDDGSSDGTREAVEEISECSDIPIKYLRQENRGPAAARNRGAREAHGRILLFLGDDVFPERNLIIEHLRKQKELRSCAVLGYTLPGKETSGSDFSKFVHIPFGESPIAALDFPFKGVQFDFSRIDDIHDLHWSYFYTCNISVPRRLFTEAGGFAEEFTDAAFEDAELGYRLWKHGVRLVFHINAAVRHEHLYNFKSFCERQYKAGKGAVIFWQKHPELWQELRFDELLDNRFILSFYNEGIRFHYLAGVIHAMGISMALPSTAKPPRSVDSAAIQKMMQDKILKEISRLRASLLSHEQRTAAALSEVDVIRATNAKLANEKEAITCEREAITCEREAALAQARDLQQKFYKYRTFNESIHGMVKACGPPWIWGSGAGGMRVAALLDVIGIEWRGFIDSDPHRHGLLLQSHPISSPEVLFSSDPATVIVASSFAIEICARLVEAGRTEGRDFLVAPLDALVD